MGLWEREKCAFGGDDCMDQCTITLPTSLHMRMKMSREGRASFAREQGGKEDHLVLPKATMEGLFKEVDRPTLLWACRHSGSSCLNLPHIG